MTTYSVFVRFRERRRLALCRRIASLDAAIECADNHRRARFHDPDAVFVLEDETGQPVDEARVRATQTAAVPPPKRSGPGLADTFPRAYSARIRDARQHLAEALTELPSAHGSVAVARTTAAIELLVAAEREMERYERLAQPSPDKD
jgi:hypothetical protein